MDDRARRIGQNEAIFRAVNEQIEELNDRFHAVNDCTLQVVCECGSIDCVEQLSLPIAAYEETRADSALFVVKPGHEIPDVEEVVADRAPAYFVVRKRPGGPEELARETDPRS